MNQTPNKTASDNDFYSEWKRWLDQDYQFKSAMTQFVSYYLNHKNINDAEAKELIAQLKAYQATLPTTSNRNAA